MSGRDLFGAALRLLGVYFLSVAAVQALSYFGQLVELGIQQVGSPATYLMGILGYAACGAVAFFGARTIVRFSYGTKNGDDPEQ